MPEAAEVAIIAEYYDFYLCNVPLLKVNILGGKFVKQPIKGLDQLQLPLTFERVSSKGKMITFHFKNSDVKMFVGLGMSGSFDTSRTTHSHVEFILDMFEPFPSAIYFTDMRRFGNIVISTSDLSAKLAPGILNGITENEFLRRCKKVNTIKDIRAVLMDQERVCSGIGNYVVAETLYRARVNPFRKFKDITEAELKLILKFAIEVATKAFESYGMSFKDFLNPDGQQGRYVHFIQVYMKLVTPKGEQVVSQKDSQNRMVWWCPEVQK